MKKLFFPLLLVLAFVLSSCSGTAVTAANNAATSTNAAAASTEGTTDYLTADYTDAVSVAEQLAVGTINLDGTDQVVTKDQAAKLLDLWQQLQTLSQPTGMGAGGDPGQNGGNQPGGANGQPPAMPDTGQNVQPDTTPTTSPSQLDGAATAQSP